MEDLAYTENLGPQGYQILPGGRILHFALIGQCCRGRG